MRRLLLAASALALPTLAAAQTLTFAGPQDGATYRTISTSRTAQTMSIDTGAGTQDIPMTSEQTMHLTLRTARTAEGWALTNTLDRSISRMESPMMPGPMEMDTDRPESIPEPQRAQMLALVGQTSTGHFTPALQHLRTEVPEGLGVGVDQGTTVFYAVGEKAPGAVWADSARMAMMGLPVLTRTTYTLREVRGDSARLTFTQSFSGEGAVQPPDLPAEVDAHMTLGGTGEGVAWVHLRDGGSRSDATSTLEGMMEMRGPQLPAALTMSIRSEVRVVQTVTRQ